MDDEPNLYMGNGCFNHHFHPLSASSIRDPNWSPKWRSRFQPWKKSRIKPPKGSRTEEPGLKWLFRLPSLPGWWLNQPIWKICSSKWESSPRFGVKIKNLFETTGRVERTVLVRWLLGKVSFHLSYEQYLKPPPSYMLLLNIISPPFLRDAGDQRMIATVAVLTWPFWSKPIDSRGYPP